MRDGRILERGEHGRHGPAGAGRAQHEEQTGVEPRGPFVLAQEAATRPASSRSRWRQGTLGFEPRAVSWAARVNACACEPPARPTRCGCTGVRRRGRTGGAARGAPGGPDKRRWVSALRSSGEPRVGRARVVLSHLPASSHTSQFGVLIVTGVAL